ncbi:MAG: ribonuclease R [Lachnospiraceae bacterium]|nr:ribonuclease R [Lachnospiraceae bacterium]
MEHKEMVLEFISSKDYSPMKYKEMATFMQVPKEAREEFRLLLEDLLREGKVFLDDKGRYRLAGSEFKTGTFLGTKKGFGFVSVPEMDTDIYVSEEATMGAFHGDTVSVRIDSEETGKRPEGTVVKILERNTKEIVGTFQKSKNYGFVVPDSQKLSSDVFVPKELTKGAVNGQKVVVTLTSYGDNKGHSPEGRITEILGHINDPGVDILSIVRAYGLPEQYPDDVYKEVEGIPDEVDPKDMAGRVDLRNVQMVTIDGEDAKDLDDAVSLTKEVDGDGKPFYHLGVHIADVSNYVKEKSPLDKEALKRGTSVYLTDRVIPMIPHKLSNGICSLNQGCDRLALSCLMDIDSKGNVVSHRICESVIKVDRRMNYSDVKKIIEDDDEATKNEYEELVPMFLEMEELALILRAKRRSRGSIDFDFPESKITLNEKGKAIDVKPYERNEATKLIEDFMLIANETVAEDAFWQELPFIYRSHENPDEEKMKKLGVFINNFGYSIKMSGDEVHPKELQKLLTKVSGKPEEALIDRITLRSMKQAKYTVSSEGHFGLAARYYCHFTSPIRRYPDLQIHRIIKENLRGKLTDKRRNHYDKILYEVADASSRLERRADEAEREVDKLKKCEYMIKHIGEEFEGVISGLTNYGIYVELPNTVEGMIRLANISGDYYYFDEPSYKLIGEHTRKEIRLGERVIIRVASCDRFLRTIDFDLVKVLDTQAEAKDE